MTGAAVVVLTAINTEYQAVRERLTDLKADYERGTRFELGTLQGTPCRVVLGLTGKGNNTAGILAERAIRRFSPVAVLFVGVAGALWDTPLGDVVVATLVYAYHGGTSEDDGFKARPRSWELDHGLAQIAAHVARAPDWADPTGTDASAPQVHFGPIAAGEVVHNSRTSAEAQWIKNTFNDALAVEMEGAGIAQAGHLSGAATAVVRGISDRADGTKSSHEDRAWQPRAAANAAAFAVRLIEHLIEQRATEREPDVPNDGSKTHPGAVAHNTSTGQVGIQAVNVTGSTVWMGASPPATRELDLAAELVALREQLVRARSTGDLDEPTYQAAQEQVDLADEALDSDPREGAGKFVLALKRLRGLIADVADLATKIATLITAANDLT